MKLAKGGKIFARCENMFKFRPITNQKHRPFLGKCRKFHKFPISKKHKSSHDGVKKCSKQQFKGDGDKKNWKPTFHLPWKNRRKEGSTFNLILIFQLYNFLNKPNNELFENGLFNASFFLHETFAIQFNYIASWNLECFNLSKIVSMSEQRRQSPPFAIRDWRNIS